MRKLKQSSALLLVVSLLLSIFSLSASALEGTARINFHPRLLREDQVAQARFNYDGTLQQGVLGEETKGIRYKLYRIADANTSRNDVEHENNVIGNGPNEIDIDGKSIRYYGNPIVKELHQNEGYIDLPENMYGLYYVVVEDMLGEGRKGEPVIISVPSTKENGEINDNVHIYSKLIAKEHKVTVRKLVNGLELDNPNQGPHIRHGNYVMKFNLKKKAPNGEWQTIKRDLFTDGRNGNYGMCNIDGLTNGEYQIVETEFLGSEHDGTIRNVLDQLGKGNLYDKFAMNNDKLVGKDAIGNDVKIGNMFEKMVKKEFTISGNDDDIIVNVDNKMRPQITKFIMDGDQKYVAKGVNPGDDINYRLEVEKPYVDGQNAANIDNNAFKNLLNEQYKKFVIHDGYLARDRKVTREANANDLNVYFVDDNGRHQLQQGADFNIEFVNNNGKDIKIDFRRGNQGFSDTVVGLMYANRENNKAHFEIDFKVKVLDAQALNGQNDLRNPDAPLNDNEINNQLGAMAMGNLEELPNDLVNIGRNLLRGDNIQLRERAQHKLSVNNLATIELDNNIVVVSNLVKSQFGLLKIRKTNDQGDPLSGAKFDLMSNNVKIGEGTSDAEGYLYFVVPVGNDVRFSEENDYLHHCGIGVPAHNNPAEQIRIFDMALNEYLLHNVYFSDDRLAINSRQYQLRETQAPDGYEIIKQSLNISMDELIKELNVTNHPRVELPFTGGMGTILFTVVGILLIGSGAYLLINSKRKKSF